MIAGALARHELDARRQAAERAEALAALQTRLDELRIRRMMLADVTRPAYALPTSMLGPVAEGLTDRLNRLELGIRTAQAGQSALLTEWTELRQPTTEADLSGLDERTAEAEQKDRVLQADAQALHRATTETRTQLQRALDAAPTTLDTLEAEIAAFVAEATDVADRSAALKIDALAIRQALATTSEGLALLRNIVAESRDELRALQGDLIGHEIRRVQRRADNAADDWMHESGQTFSEIVRRVDALTSDASIHRTPALVAQSRFQSRLTRMAAARDGAEQALRMFSTRHNRRLDGVMQSMLGLQLRVEDRREQIRGAIMERMTREAEEHRLEQLVEAEDQIKPTADVLAGRTSALLAAQANLQDVNALLARSREHEAADAARRAQADQLLMEITGLEAQLEADSRDWVPPVQATLIRAQRRLSADSASTRMTIAAVVAGGAFILLTLLIIPFAFRGRARVPAVMPSRDLALPDFALTGESEESLAGGPVGRGRAAIPSPPRPHRSRV